MLRVISSLIKSLPGDPDFDSKVEAYFAKKESKTKVVYRSKRLMAVIYVVMKSNATDEGENFLPATSFTSWSEADSLMNECIEYNKKAPSTPTIGTVEAWDAFGNVMDKWREDHPLRKYDNKCKVKTTDYYAVVSITLQ